MIWQMALTSSDILSQAETINIIVVRVSLMKQTKSANLRNNVNYKVMQFMFYTSQV